MSGETAAKATSDLTTMDTDSDTIDNTRAKLGAGEKNIDTR